MIQVTGFVHCWSNASNWSNALGSYVYPGYLSCLNYHARTHAQFTFHNSFCSCWIRDGRVSRNRYASSASVCPPPWCSGSERQDASTCWAVQTDTGDVSVDAIMTECELYARGRGLLPRDGLGNVHDLWLRHVAEQCDHIMWSNIQHCQARGSHIHHQTGNCKQ